MLSSSPILQFMKGFARIAVALMPSLLGQRQLRQSRPKIFTELALVIAMAVLPTAHTIEGISRQGLNEEAVRSGQTVGQILRNQITHAALAFNSYRDTSTHYAPELPVLWGLAAALMLLGLTYALLRLHRRPYHILVLWFDLTLFFGDMMLRLPPGSALDHARSGRVFIHHVRSRATAVRI